MMKKFVWLKPITQIKGIHFKSESNRFIYGNVVPKTVFVIPFGIFLE